MRAVRRLHVLAATLVACTCGATVLTPVADAQVASERPYGRVSFNVYTTGRSSEGQPARRDSEISTSLTFVMPDADTGGAEFGVDIRQARRFPADRPSRLSIYDGYAGVRSGGPTQLRVRGGHMWLQDMGTVGALAGILGEVRHGSLGEGTRVRAGVFAGLEPLVYDTGYAPGVRKEGGYFAIENGYLRRHTVGFARVHQGGLTERALLTFSNFIPAGKRFFAYQAAEFDIKGPANGTAGGGLSYFLANVRVSPTDRVEILGTYNRGRALDARGLTDDLLKGRPLTAQAIEGLRYQSAGARLTVEVVKNVRLYGGIATDRNNRDDEPTARVTLGGHAGNLFGSGFDVSASDARINRPDAPYHSRYFSVGHALGRAVYISADYSTSLSVVRFQRSDGLVIETRPWTRQFTINGSAMLNRYLSLLVTVDDEADDSSTGLRLFTGLSYRIQ
jgi:hypothetical protein